MLISAQYTVANSATVSILSVSPCNMYVRADRALEGWVQLKDEQSGHPYYYNQVQNTTALRCNKALPTTNVPTTVKKTVARVVWRSIAPQGTEYMLPIVNDKLPNALRLKPLSAPFCG